MDWPSNQEGWQTLLDKFFEGGVIVTYIAPGTQENGASPQFLGDRVYVESVEDDGTPNLLVENVLNDYPLRVNVETITEEAKGHVLVVRTADEKTFVYSNRLVEGQRAFLKARKEQGW